jgi:hypothetical protein
LSLNGEIRQSQSSCGVSSPVSTNSSIFSLVQNNKLEVAIFTLSEHFAACDKDLLIDMSMYQDLHLLSQFDMFEVSDRAFEELIKIELVCAMSKALYMGMFELFKDLGHRCEKILQNSTIYNNVFKPQMINLENN